MGLAAQMMRRILVNHAETRKAAKRGEGKENVPLDEAAVFRILQYVVDVHGRAFDHRAA